MPASTAGADVTPAIPSFDPPDTEVDVLKLTWEKAAAWKLAGRVLGDAQDGSRAIKNSAKEFSEIISTDISSANSYNSQEWQNACMALTYAASIAEMWCEDVEDFQEKRRKLINRYRTEAYAITDKVDSSGYYQPGTIWAVPKGPEAVREMLADLVARYQKTGQDSYQKLLDTAEKRAAMLEEGPEPKNLKLLVEAGILGWGAHNILGVDKDTPLPVSAEKAKELVRDLELFLRGGVEPDSRVTEALAVLAAVSDKARALQQAGGKRSGKLSDDEIEFLETFYGELEDMTPTGVVHVMPWLEGDSGPDWSAAERKAFATGVSNGLLALSDEDIGGGQERLPESVQDLANGIPFTAWRENGLSGSRAEGVDSHNWLADADDFSRLLRHSDPGLRGGTEFSSNLTLSTGHHLGNDHLAITREREKALGALLDVSTRNEEANHRVLTTAKAHPGSHTDDPRYDAARMPGFDSNADALLGLYGHDWKDGGEAVAGLTDWIPEFSRGTSAQADMAGTATVGLMETLAGNGDEKPFHDAADDSETRHSLAVTEINPELTESLVRIYENYEDDFILHENDTNRYATVSGPEERYLLHEPGDRALHLTNGTKEGFLQLLIADDRTAPIITASVEELERRVINTAVGDPTEGVAGVAGGRVGTIRTLLHDAMINEYTSRYDDSEEAKQHAADNWQTAFNISVAINNGVFGSVPGAGSGLATGGETILRLLEHPQKEEYLERWEKEAEEREEKRRKNDGVDPDYDPMSGFIDSKVQANRHAQLQLLQVYLDRGVVDPQTLKDSNLLPANHDVTAGHVFPAVVESMSQDPGGDFPRLDKVLEEASKKAGANGGNKDWVDDYLADMERSYEPEKYVPKSMKR
ncbi:hypothetical protein GCM10007079_22520 [Nocardiopsis terrae]|uniref:TPR repeat domain-containing protein n=1 Tax=Nocardiopsis terrae TaxID=372655 RepID=A0ABR9HGH1_9ACTN|nr:hypothetical protein [Nocardiopsis terrae]MBE1458135.1 hypothetical protein [Nocardiopsis terrae]GHC81973.1 hypothetical protein GCM10007079_22520 [Nocardiopsis terrae]